MIRLDSAGDARCDGNGLVFDMGPGTGRLTPWAPNVLHVLLSPGNAPVDAPLFGIDGQPQEGIAFSHTEDESKILLRAEGISAEVDKQTGRVRFLDGAETVLAQLDEMCFQPVQVSGEDTYSIYAGFDGISADECFYGLGQHQSGWLNHRGKKIKLWHDYGDADGEVIGIPFLVSSGNYGVLFDNTSRGEISCARGKPARNQWSFEIGDCISFFVIAATEPAALYRAFRQLCGETPLPPRYALGYIQCKQRYGNQDEIMTVAQTYREKDYPCDLLVVDWYHWKCLGDMSLDPAHWPDPEAMNAELADMGYHVMISCWPRFLKESRHYDELEAKGMFMTDSSGDTLYGTPLDRRGALLDTTNPDAGSWFWDRIHENYGKRGFCSWWTDENEPDISPYYCKLHVGTGARYHNVYPLTHSRAIYEGHRRDREDRCLILSRSAWYGAQQCGTTFWSSDIEPTWDVFRRQLPAAMNFCLSGFAWWSSDIGGWQPNEFDGGWGPKTTSSSDYDEESPDLLLTTDSASKDVPQNAAEYAELYVRWFQFGAFSPTFRAHGTRPENEVWSFGRKAEAILVEYLNLRYRLMPYLYSLARATQTSGVPLMRPMWYDFPGDADCHSLTDQYMFGPAFLVAPVLSYRAESREVYLPAGRCWFDFWTGERHEGGQRIDVEAPLERLPLFVPAGTIVPMGEVVPHTGVEQKQIQMHVYGGADARFELYRDDGISYRYEQGEFELVTFEWDDAAGSMTVRNSAADEFAEGAEDTWLVRHD